jgi:hypothetical protein
MAPTATKAVNLLTEKPKCVGTASPTSPTTAWAATALRRHLADSPDRKAARPLTTLGGEEPRNEAGKIVGTGKLDNGEQLRNGIADTGCLWNFSVSVPKADFYAFEIGRRKGVTKSFAEMESDDWKIGSQI